MFQNHQYRLTFSSLTGLTAVIGLILSSCSEQIQTFGIVNSTDKEITIETKPNIRYTGGPEKYIGQVKDTTNRGLVWKIGPIDAIVIRPLTAQPVYDSTGQYIMMPGSGFQIGDFYKPVDETFDSKTLDIFFLKITTSEDTLVLRGRNSIWNALNYDVKEKKNKKIFYDKAIVVD